jgi:hypothetical protein
MSGTDDDDIPVRNFVEEDDNVLDNLQIEKAREVMNDFNKKDANTEGY